MNGMLHETRRAVRALARDRGFSLAAAATLVLCLGANALLFSVVEHVLLRPLPIPEPERILLMSNQYPRAGATDSANSGVPDYFDRLRETTVYSHQALYNHGSVAVGEEGLPVRLQAAFVTPSYFRLMGVGALRGRTFTEEEGEPGRDRAVVLSEGLWRRLFAGDPAALGRELRLDGRPFTVVGVMPAAFDRVDPGTRLWRPLAFSAEQKADGARHSNNFFNLGRLRPGATPAQAQAQVDALNAANLERFPQYKELLLNAGFHTTVERLQDWRVKHVRPALLLLWGGALFVLLIGAVNVTNLVLVRARARLRELATRIALGADVRHLARQAAAEGLVLALVSAAGGLALAALALRWLTLFDLESLPYGADIGLRSATVSYTLGLSALLGLAIGLAPLPAVYPSELTALLREEGRAASAGRGARGLRRALVVAQVAFTFVLLLGAGLLLASFRKVLEVDPGFEPARVLTASVSLPRSRYEDDDARRAFTAQALHRLRALPGVRGAGATDTIPFGGRHGDSVILAEGYRMRPGESLVSPATVVATPGYFEAVGARLVRGRFFRDSDHERALRVAVVDETLARHFWPGEDPLGRRLYRPTDINDLMAVTGETEFITVVGVVADLKLRGLAEERPWVGACYFPMAQDTSGLMTFALATSAPPAALAASLRSSLAGLDRELPVFDLQTMEQRIEKSLLHRRGPAALASSFAAVALLLSAVGLYGVLAYLVSQRRKEIGIRMALGGTAPAVFTLVIREGVALIASGLLLGALAALALRRALQSQLFGIAATDPLVLAAATTLLLAVALLACALPAQRATRINPLSALSE